MAKPTKWLGERKKQSKETRRKQRRQQEGCLYYEAKTQQVRATKLARKDAKREAEAEWKRQISKLGDEWALSCNKYRWILNKSNDVFPPMLESSTKAVVNMRWLAMQSTIKQEPPALVDMTGSGVPPSDPSPDPPAMGCDGGSLQAAVGRFGEVMEGISESFAMKDISAALDKLGISEMELDAVGDVAQEESTVLEEKLTCTLDGRQCRPSKGSPAPTGVTHALCAPWANKSPLSAQDVEMIKVHTGKTLILNAPNKHCIVSKEGWFRLIQPNTWLNDESINCFFQLMSNEDTEMCIADRKRRRSLFLTSFFVMKLFDWSNKNEVIRGKFMYKNVCREIKKKLKREEKEDLLQFERIFIPVHLPWHWVCAIIDTKKKEIQWYDSMGGFREDIAKGLVQVMHESLKSENKHQVNVTEWKTSSMAVRGIPQQTNGTSRSGRPAKCWHTQNPLLTNPVPC